MRRARFSELRAAIEKAAGDPAAVRKLLAEDGAAGDMFGERVAVDDDIAVIGAYSDDDNGKDFGSAYVFARATDGTWSQQAKLTAADGAADAIFGWSVAVDGGTAVIGTWRDGDKGRFAGAVYVFVRAANGTWSQQAKLTAEDGDAGNWFGWSVAVDGGTAVIGAAGRSNSAYVFVRAANGTWSQQAKLTGEGGSELDSFGNSVAVDGDTAVIGVEGDAVNGIRSGSAYVFVRAADGTWSQQAKLTAEDGTEWDLFGGSVAVSGGTAVIGARHDVGGNGYVDGSAYVFARAADGTWSQQVKLTTPDPVFLANDAFGSSVAVDGGTAVITVVGSSYDGRGEKSGAAYVFVRAANGTWSKQAKLTASDEATDDQFGHSVSISGDTVLIGAYGDDDRGENSGSAYVFVRAADGTWSQQAAV
ncbi:FG-GAP repeat protein [Candidatus Electronema sp. PJ]|uniref:FG-GAP repeat protein n=1 Tax=Candidatus Electronema sp. PJ TaxID=3401572 RepID=UPI003AA83076